MASCSLFFGFLAASMWGRSDAQYTYLVSQSKWRACSGFASSVAYITGTDTVYSAGWATNISRDPLLDKTKSSDADLDLACQALLWEGHVGEIYVIDKATDCTGCLRMAVYPRTEEGLVIGTISDTGAQKKWVCGKAATPPRRATCPTPQPTPDLNNGQWSLHDINYYRHFVTSGAKSAATQQLKDLMAMNETNETELLLLAPITEAPTPMPPTPAPTPIPQDVLTTVPISNIGSAVDFVSSGAAGDLVPDAQNVQTAFEVKASTTLDVAPSELECKEGFALTWAVQISAVACTIVEVPEETTSGEAGGRRLAAAAVEASTTTSDPAAADQIAGTQNAAATLTSNLKAINAAKFEYLTATPVATQTDVTVTITQVAQDADEAAKMANAADATVQANAAAVAQKAGIDASKIAAPVSTVEQVPTPTPTKVPTATPTALPAGFSVAPTQLPTSMPSKMPTAMPTKSPTAAPTASPTKTPTATPTATPTKAPTATPTASPTKSPTASPTKSPTKMPTSAPTPIPPTSAPTMSPTNATEEESGAHQTAGFVAAAVLAFTSAMAAQ